MAVDVLTETVIDRPRDEVARYAGDPSNAPAWYVNIESIDWESEPRVEVGARMASPGTAQVLARARRDRVIVARR